MSDLDPAVIIAKHERHHGHFTAACCTAEMCRDGVVEPHCLPYRLAAENVRLAAQVEAVRAAVEDVRMIASHLAGVHPERRQGALMAVERVRAALATEGAEP